MAIAPHPCPLPTGERGFGSIRRTFRVFTMVIHTEQRCNLAKEPHTKPLAMGNNQDRYAIYYSYSLILLQHHVNDLLARIAYHDRE
jgi:hypothetical protein